MLNMDMVGRLTDDKLIVHGTGTASELDPLVDRLGKQFGFKITKKAGGFGPSDHSSFYREEDARAALFHRQAQRLSPAERRLRQAEHRRHAPRGRDGGGHGRRPGRSRRAARTFRRPRRRAAGGGGGDRPYFGSIPDFSQDETGYAISGSDQGRPGRAGRAQGGRRRSFNSATARSAIWKTSTAPCASTRPATRCRWSSSAAAKK